VLGHTRLLELVEPAICCRYYTVPTSAESDQGLAFTFYPFLVSAKCNIYISRLCYDVNVRLSVRLSVTEVHWRIIANLGFKFRTQFTAHCGRGACGREGRDHRREA